MRNRMLAIAAVIAGGTLVIVTTLAQPVRREVLKDLEVTEVGGCQRITARFQFPITLEGYAPLEGGALLRVKVEPLLTPEVARQALAGREALVPPAHTETPLVEVTWEGDTPGDLQLVFRFSHPVPYDVATGPDFRSITILLRPVTTDPASCLEGVDSDAGPTS